MLIAEMSNGELQVWMAAIAAVVLLINTFATIAGAWISYLTKRDTKAANQSLQVAENRREEIKQEIVNNQVNQLR